MKRKLGLIAGLLMLAVVIAFLISSCATIYHGYFMRGSIIEAYDSDVYLCIGSKDGATVGQELDVHKIISVSTGKRPTFERIHTGKVRITEIIDVHFAKAKVISGKAEKHNIVELAAR